MCIRDRTRTLLDRRPVHLSSGQQEIPFYDGEKLIPGNQIHGPAVVLRPDTTILLERTDQASVDPYLNLTITVGSHD